MELELCKFRHIFEDVILNSPGRFCPSVFLYLASVVPGLWLLNFDLYGKRIDYRDSMNLEDCSSETVYNSSSLSSDAISGVRHNHLF